MLFTHIAIMGVITEYNLGLDAVIMMFRYLAFFRFVCSLRFREGISGQF
jgi:hypothetical protein